MVWLMKKRLAKRMLTVKELTETTGYSIRRLRQFIKDGLPHGTRKNPHGGKRILIFDQDKVEFYLAERDLITPKQMEQALKEIAKGERETCKELGFDKLFSRLKPIDIDFDDIPLPELDERKGEM